MRPVWGRQRGAGDAALRRSPRAVLELSPDRTVPDQPQSSGQPHRVTYRMSCLPSMLSVRASMSASGRYPPRPAWLRGGSPSVAAATTSGRSSAGKALSDRRFRGCAGRTLSRDRGAAALFHPAATRSSGRRSRQRALDAHALVSPPSFDNGGEDVSGDGVPSSQRAGVTRLPSHTTRSSVHG